MLFLLVRLLHNEELNPGDERDILVTIPELLLPHDSTPQRIQGQRNSTSTQRSTDHRTDPPALHLHSQLTTMALRILPLLAVLLSLASTDAFSQPASGIVANGRRGTSLFSTVARALPEGECMYLFFLFS